MCLVTCLLFDYFRSCFHTICICTNNIQNSFTQIPSLFFFCLRRPLIHQMMYWTIFGTRLLKHLMTSAQHLRTWELTSPITAFSRMLFGKAFRVYRLNSEVGSIPMVPDHRPKNNGNCPMYRQFQQDKCFQWQPLPSAHHSFQLMLRCCQQHYPWILVRWVSGPLLTLCVLCKLFFFHKSFFLLLIWDLLYVFGNNVVDLPVAHIIHCSLLVIIRFVFVHFLLYTRVSTAF